MDIKQIVLDLCALSDEQEWFEMRRLFIIKNMRISFGE